VILTAAAADKPLTDGGVRDQVMIKLAADAEVRGGDLKVDVQNGVATLTGFVDSQKRIDKATKIAKKVKGVKSVVNHIAIKDKNAGK
jgi:osmotically-inducible protein OsmY